MIRARTLVRLRRLLQGAAYRALLAGADGLVAVAGWIAPGGAAPAARPLRARRQARWLTRERLRTAALKVLVEAILARPLGDRESSVALALSLARDLRAMRHGLSGPRLAPEPAVESLRQAALRRLAEALLGRPLARNESEIGIAMDLAVRVRRDHPLLARERAARLDGPYDGAWL